LYSSEILWFDDAVNEFRENFDKMSQEIQMDTAKTIFSEYIKRGSPNEVNISSETRDKLSQMFAAIAKVGVMGSIFDGAHRRFC
jgi:hypothetical protein